MLKEKFNDDERGSGLPQEVLDDIRDKSEHCFEIRSKFHGMRVDKKKDAHEQDKEMTITKTELCGFQYIMVT